MGKSPLIWQYNITQGYFLSLKRPLLDLCIIGFAQKFFNRILRLLSELSALEMFIFSAFHWLCNTRIQHDMENLVCCLILMVKKVKLNNQNGGFFHIMFHPLPDSYRYWYLSSLFCNLKLWTVTSKCNR